MMQLSFKRLTLSFITVLSLLALSGCGLTLSNKADEEKMKNLEKRVNELQSELTETKQKTKQAEEEQKETSATTTKESSSSSTPSSTSGSNFILIETPTGEGDTTFFEHPVKFVGRVSPTTTKITVQATTPSSKKVDEYTLKSYKAGSTTFNYGAAPQWNNLTPGTNTYIFTAYFQDGTSKSTSSTVSYVEGGAEMGKPVIYLYPTETTNVSVNVRPTGGVTISVPEIGNGWNVQATPKGLLTNNANGQEYPYLFWEGYATNFETPSKGFVVAQEEVPAFFDRTLGYMGLNTKEIEDFKEFWVPKFNDKPYYFITYISQEVLDRYAPLEVAPQPDTSIRVFFDYKGLDSPIRVEEQTLQLGVRNGFTLIEWGGRLYR